MQDGVEFGRGGDYFCYTDIGARGGAISPKDTELPVVRVLFEPEPSEFEKLRQANPNDIVIGSAVGNVDGEINFYEAENPYCSSALKPNMAFLDDYRIAPNFRTKHVWPVRSVRFDTLYRTGRVPVPHCVKIDVQGFEYDVLEGFGDVLQEVLAIRLEAHFYPLYEGQKLLNDCVSLLSGHDFMLRRLMNHRSPDLNGDRHFMGDLVEVDAIFTKSRKWMSSRPDLREKFLLASSMLGVSPY